MLKASASVNVGLPIISFSVVLITYDRDLSVVSSRNESRCFAKTKFYESKTVGDGVFSRYVANEFLLYDNSIYGFGK